jgi:hypothetical protein
MLRLVLCLITNKGYKSSREMDLVDIFPKRIENSVDYASSLVNFNEFVIYYPSKANAMGESDERYDQIV